MICDVINIQAIPRLLQLNGMNPPHPPRLAHGALERLDLAEVAAAIKTLSDAGFSFDTSATGPLTKRLLDEAQLPEPPEDSTQPEDGQPATPGEAEPAVASGFTDPDDEIDAATAELTQEYEAMIAELLTPHARQG